MIILLSHMGIYDYDVRVCANALHHRTLIITNHHISLWNNYDDFMIFTLDWMGLSKFHRLSTTALSVPRHKIHLQIHPLFMTSINLISYLQLHFSADRFIASGSGIALHSWTFRMCRFDYSNGHHIYIHKSVWRQHNKCFLHPKINNLWSTKKRQNCQIFVFIYCTRELKWRESRMKMHLHKLELNRININCVRRVINSNVVIANFFFFLQSQF